MTKFAIRCLAYLAVGAAMMLGQQPLPPASVTASDVDGRMVVTIQNASDQRLTAVALTGTSVGKGPDRPEMFDSEIKRWQALAPHSNSRIIYQAPTPEKKPELLAAIFQDGTVFGSSAAVNSLLDERRYVLAALESVIRNLPGPPAKDSSRQDIVQAFQEARRQEFKEAYNAILKGSLINVNLIIQRRLKALPEGVPPDEAFSTIGGMVLDWRMALQTSKPVLE